MRSGHGQRMSQNPPAIVANSETDRKVIVWLERNLGPVTRFAPHARWRAGWDAEVVQDGKPLALYMRAMPQRRWRSTSSAA